MTTPVLELVDLRKSFGQTLVLHDVNLTVPEHTATVLIGASGSGKSTLLRCINLLEPIDDGLILLDGQEISDPAIDVGFPFAEHEKIAQAFGLASLPIQKGFLIIWTTTPWTIPSNQALNMHPEFDYALVQTERNGEPLLLILAQALVESCLQRYGIEGKIIATWKSPKPSIKTDYQQLALEHPDWLIPYQSQQEGSRRLLIKEPS